MTVFPVVLVMSFALPLMAAAAGIYLAVKLSNRNIN